MRGMFGKFRSRGPLLAVACLALMLVVLPGCVIVMGTYDSTGTYNEYEPDGTLTRSVSYDSSIYLTNDQPTWPFISPTINGHIHVPLYGAGSYPYYELSCTGRVVLGQLYMDFNHWDGNVLIKGRINCLTKNIIFLDRILLTTVVTEIHLHNSRGGWLERYEGGQLTKRAEFTDFDAYLFSVSAEDMAQVEQFAAQQGLEVPSEYYDWVE